MKNYGLYFVFMFLALSVADIYREYASGETLLHLAFEIVICLVAAVLSLYVLLSWKKARNELTLTLSENLELKKINLEWKQKNSELFSRINLSINKQFEEWKLTPAESDIALLLLKGLPFKEIAQIREGSEKTVRHHALKIYQKSGLPGRTELFAYFFEDIFNPQNEK